MSCGGCGQGCGCLSVPFMRVREAFEGLPYDSCTYYAGGLAPLVENVRTRLHKALLAGGVNEVKVEPQIISMSRWFSGKRDYLLVKYAGVQVYVLIAAFGQDLYAAWTSFFNPGCVQYLVRLGKLTPPDLDVDDLDMLGLSTDTYLREVLDQALRSAGLDRKKMENIFAQAKRKQFTKT